MTAATPGLDTWARNRADRCSGCGHHVATQGCHCNGSDQAIFMAALRQARRPDGTIHARDMRPLLRGRMKPNAISSAYREARAIGLLVEAGHERSNDHEGKNAGRLEPYYSLHLDAIAATSRAAA